MNTLQTIQALLTEKFGLAADQVHADARLDALGIDSLAAIEFLFLLEDTFKLPESERPAAIRTVGDIAAHIDHLLARQQHSTPRSSAAGR